MTRNYRISPELPPSSLFSTREVNKPLICLTWVIPGLPLYLLNQILI